MHFGASAGQGHFWRGPGRPAKRGLMWPHLVSSGFIWRHLASSGLIWRHLASFGFIWPHLASSGFIWPHPASSGLIWRHLASSGFIWRVNCRIDFFAISPFALWHHFCMIPCFFYGMATSRRRRRLAGELFLLHRRGALQ